MRIVKIVVIGLLALIILLGVGAYFYFNKRFTPPPNYLELSSSSQPIPIQWIQSEYSEIAALLLPVKLKGIPTTFYMQFDTGSPKTIFYKNRMIAICEKFPDQMAHFDSNSVMTEQWFRLGEMDVYSDQFELYDRGTKSIDWSDTTAIIRIGTLGADFLEKRITIMDFQKGTCAFETQLPDMGRALEWHDLKFSKRRVLIPATVAGRSGKLMHDTGTSGFDLVTSKKIWKKLAREGAEPEEAFKVKSWKRELTAYNIASDKAIEFKAASVDLSQVTYIEGASFWQVALMRMLGMGGMIGNQVFQGKVLILDCANSKYAILD